MIMKKLEFFLSFCHYFTANLRATEVNYVAIVTVSIKLLMDGIVVRICILWATLWPHMRYM